MNFYTRKWMMNEALSLYEYIFINLDDVSKEEIVDNIIEKFEDMYEAGEDRIRQAE